MKNVESCLREPEAPRMISMAATDGVPVYLEIVYWHWMLQPEKVYIPMMVTPYSGAWYPPFLGVKK
jgi:hypothetical protein